MKRGTTKQICITVVDSSAGSCHTHVKDGCGYFLHACLDSCGILQPATCTLFRQGSLTYHPDRDRYDRCEECLEGSKVSGLLAENKKVGEDIESDCGGGWAER